MKKVSKILILTSVLLLFFITTVIGSTIKESIEVIYRDIKIYIDGNLIEAKDANGKKVEAFIYNGTTYLPVRAVGEAFGKEVKWDGTNNSVYVGVTDNSTLYAMDVCPPYDYKDSDYIEEYSKNNKDKFMMSGVERTNGFVMTTSFGDNYINYALFNLNGEYNKISFYVGREDDSYKFDCILNVYADGKLLETYNLKNDELAKLVEISVKDVLQLKLELDGTGAYKYMSYGFSDIILEK